MEVWGENCYVVVFGVCLIDDVILCFNGGYDVFGGFSENDSLCFVFWNFKE